MQTFFRTAILLVLVAGVSRPAEAAKKCREPGIPNPFGIFGCKSTFTKEGTSDVGGNKDDTLQTRKKRLSWWIYTDETLKLEFQNFDYCPGTFTVEGNSYENCPPFTVKDKKAGWTVVKLKAKDEAAGRTVKFDIVITDIVSSNTIDPQIEIDTDPKMNFLWIVLLPIVGLVVVTLVTLWFIRASRRKQRGAR